MIFDDELEVYNTINDIFRQVVEGLILNDVFVKSYVLERKNGKWTFLEGAKFDFTEHDKKVTEEKDNRISELEKELSKANDIYMDLRSRVTADAIEYFVEEKYDRLVITLPENMANAKRNIELEDRHQSDCIEINRLHTALEVMTEKYMKLREVHGL